MKVGFPLKRLPEIVDLVAVVAVELDDGEDEIIWLVQRVEDFIARDGDGRGSLKSAL